MMRAIITGAASGIGRATAAKLDQQGAELVLWDVAAVALMEVAAELAVPYTAVDVRDEAAVKAATSEALTYLDGIDAVIHAAGVVKTGSFGALPLSEHRRMLEVNLWGTMVMAHTLMPYLVESEGSFVVMGSANAFYGAPDFASYGATKAGVVNLVEALDIEYESVHVGAVCPAFVATPMSEDPTNTHDGDDPYMMQALGIHETAESIADLIVYNITERELLTVPESAQQAYEVSRKAPEKYRAGIKRLWASRE